MARTTEVPLNPAISPNQGSVTAGLATDLRAKINTYIAAVEDKAQLAQAYLEEFANAYGYGAISGGTIAAGAGLNITISPYKAFVGNVVENPGSGTVALTDDATNYLWLRQGAVEWTAGTAGTAPGDTTANGAALLWGTAVASGGSVTSVGNARAWISPPPWSVGTISLGTANSGTVTVTGEQAHYCMLVFAGTVTGTVTANMPTIPAAMWTIYNGGTPSVTLKTAGLTGVTVATLKHAIVRFDGTDVRRVTADV